MVDPTWRGPASADGAGAGPDDATPRVLEAVGRALGHFAMLRSGDRVAVGLSGGKDSLCLLDALVAHRRRSPVPYEVVAVTVEQGKFKTPIRALESHLAFLGVPWVLAEDARTLRLVREGVLHGCDVCSRHRRGALYRLAAEAGCGVLALGHTADDCAEALLRNILFNGRIASLPPVATSRKGALRLIRPLVFVGEALTAAYTEARGLAPVACACAERHGVRSEIRAFLTRLSAGHPGVPASIAAALANVNPYTLFDPRLAPSQTAAEPEAPGV